jgi:hypothetical protein
MREPVAVVPAAPGVAPGVHEPVAVVPAAPPSPSVVHEPASPMPAAPAVHVVAKSVPSVPAAHAASAAPKPAAFDLPCPMHPLHLPCPSPPSSPFQCPPRAAPAAPKPGAFVPSVPDAHAARAAPRACRSHCRHSLSHSTPAARPSPTRPSRAPAVSAHTPCVLYFRSVHRYPRSPRLSSSPLLSRTLAPVPLDPAHPLLHLAPAAPQA